MHDLVLVTCGRDRDLTRLLIQSLAQYYQGQPKLWIINCDRDPQLTRLWRSMIKPWGDRFQWEVLDQRDFDLHYLAIPRPRERLRWWLELEPHRLRMEGWINQQLLKLAVYELLDSEQGDYLVMDSQNFLIRPWAPPEGSRTPYRRGPWSMSPELWHKYSREFGLGSEPPEIMQSLCTPIFLNKTVIDQLVASKGGVRSWSQWFVEHGGQMASEFLCVWAWAQSRGVWDQYHQEHSDWARCYLRDCDNFDSAVDRFLVDLDMDIEHQCWSSINHRAWQLMSDSQLARVQAALARRNLSVNLDYLRNQWPREELPRPNFE